MFSINEQLNLPIAIPLGEERTLTIRFIPDQMSDYTGILEFDHTDTNKSPFEITLRANSIIADLPLFSQLSLGFLTLVLLLLSVNIISKM